MDQEYYWTWLCSRIRNKEFEIKLNYKIINWINIILQKTVEYAFSLYH